jgi:hypothetical protein
VTLDTDLNFALTYVFGVNGVGQVTDDNGDRCGECSRDNGEIEVVDMLDDTWLEIRLATHRRGIHEFQRQSDSPSHQAYHQCPKRSLDVIKNIKRY